MLPIFLRASGLALLLLLGQLLSAQVLEVFVDRPLQAYEPGETVIFKVRSENLRGQLTWRVRLGARTALLQEGTLQYDGGVVEVPYRPEIEAGFVNFEVSLAGNGAAAAVTVGRDKIDAFFEEPADFDAFWANQKAALAAVPYDVQRWVSEQTDLSTTYQFSAAQIDGRRVYGYMTIPKAAGPFPASLRLPPFGAGANSARPEINAAEKANYIAVSISIHNANANQEDFNAYRPEDLRNRETIYYRYAILAAIRAIDVIAQEAQWDRRNLLIYGDSQGGGLSMLVAGIDGRPTHLAQSVAALSQHGGELLNRPAGFPYYLETGQALYSTVPSDVSRVFESVRYYDAIYAARRFYGPSIHFVNYLDPTCPPATHYAAFNAMRGPKVVLHSFDLYHNNPTEFTEDIHDFSRAHIPATSNPPFQFGTRRKGFFVDAGQPLSTETGKRVQFTPYVTYDDQAPQPDWTFSWTKVSGPGDVSFENQTGLNAAATFSAAGEYRIRMQVIDPYPEQPRKYWLLTDELVVNVTRTDTGSTAINAFAALGEVQLSPNPANQEVRFQATVGSAIAVQLDLFDAFGRMVAQYTPANTGGKVDFLMPVAELPRGHYTLSLKAEGFTPVQRALLLQ